jgi:hypothetical protein
MRTRRKQVTRLVNRRARASRVPGDCQLPFDVGRIHTGCAARYPRHHRRRPQVHEHMPRLAQDNGLVAPQAIGFSNCDRGIDRTHVAILDRRSDPARCDERCLPVPTTFAGSQCWLPTGGWPPVPLRSDLEEARPIRVLLVKPARKLRERRVSLLDHWPAPSSWSTSLAQKVEGYGAQRRASSNRGSLCTAAKSSSLRASSRNRGSSSTDRRRWANVTSSMSPASVAKQA